MRCSFATLWPRRNVALRYWADKQHEAALSKVGGTQEWQPSRVLTDCYRAEGGMMRLLSKVAVASAVLALAACGGSDYSPDSDVGPRSGPVNKYNPADDSLFGEDGASLSAVFGGGSTRRTPGQSDAIPVNKYLWRAALDTLSFLPLSSTDPFTGVIATDWGANPDAPGERFKVTAYMVRPTLAASSLKVAVYREVRGEGGAWVPASVSADTARKIEDAILIRARQIRIAEVEGGATG